MTAAMAPDARGRTVPRRAPHVLIVSSDPETRVGLAVLLEAEGYSHAAPATPHASIVAEHAEQPDLLVLDLTCEAPQAALLLAAARDARHGAPAAFLVPADRARLPLPGFRAETDGVLASPFTPAHVLTLVRALLPQEGRPERDGARYRVGDVEVDAARGVVTKHGEEVRLPPMTLRVLVALARAEGRVVSKRELWRAVWNDERRGPTRALDTHVFALRRIIEADPARPALLLTYNRRGYRLVCDRVG